MLDTPLGQQWSFLSDIFKKIRIIQTKRTKSPYPQLVIFSDEKPLVFYPQARAREEITILDFLEGFLKKRIKCLHELNEVYAVFL